jgi:hypothetical protein
MGWERWQDGIEGRPLTGHSRRYLEISLCMIGGCCKNQKQQHPPRFLQLRSGSHHPPVVPHLYNNPGSTLQ